MTNYRWDAEVKKMKESFKDFVPFIRDNIAGFIGTLQGRSSQVYQVEVSVRADKYPARSPDIYINPRVGKNWLPGGALCVNRKWRPDRDTFAQQVLYAAAYLQQHG